MNQSQLFDKQDPEVWATCPRCDFSGDIDDFEVMGSCADQVFCPRCHGEFCPATGQPHLHDPAQMSCYVCARWLEES